MRANDPTNRFPLAPRLSDGADGCVRRRWDRLHDLVREQLGMIETLELIRTQEGHRRAYRRAEG